MSWVRRQAKDLAMPSSIAGGCIFAAGASWLQARFAASAPVLHRLQVSMVTTIVNG